MLALYSSIPIIFIIILMAVFNKPAKVIIPIALILNLVIAFFVWKIDILHLITYGFLGTFKALEVVAIIFGAVWLLNILRQSGALFTINNMFSNISNDKRVQLIIVGLLFEAFMEAVAGFGSPGALGAPLLISLGFPPMLAIILALMFDGIPVIFGAVGAPVISTLSSLHTLLLDSNISKVDFAISFVNKTAFLNLISGFLITIFALVITIFIFGGKQSNKLKSFLEIIPFALYSTLAFLIPFYLFSLNGYELPSLLGSIIGLSLVILTTIKFKFLIPNNVWNFEDKSKWLEDWKSNASSNNDVLIDKNISLFKALFPYLLIAIILVITRLPIFGLMKHIKAIYVPFGEFLNVLHLPFYEYNFLFLSNPGIFPFVFIAIFVSIYHKVSFKDSLNVFITTSKQLKSSAIALISVFIIVQVMIYSKSNPLNIDGMLSSMSKFIALYADKYFIWISYYIGGLGTFLGGSGTLSNVLFAGLQFESAQYTNLSPALILALQSSGGALGTMIAINKIIAVSATAGILGKEGKILRYTLIPFALYGVVITLFAIILYT
jgi:lactate permease